MDHRVRFTVETRYGEEEEKMETIESDSAVHVVRFPTQLGEHLDRIVLRLGFLKNSSVQLDDCIASYRI